MNPFQIVKDFEQAICEYTGARYCVAVTSCTNALLLCCSYLKVKEVTIPKKTYIGVPMSIIHAGGSVKFDDREWWGLYRLKPYPVWDSARWLTSHMYAGGYICLSFHWAKTLGIGQGGAILHDNPEAEKILRKMRFDGRTEGVKPKDDKVDVLGYHCYMMPRDAAEGLTRLALLPKYNDPLPKDDYPDLSKLEIFRKEDKVEEIIEEIIVGGIRYGRSQLEELLIPIPRWARLKIWKQKDIKQ